MNQPTESSIKNSVEQAVNSGAVLDDFSTWREFLGDHVKHAESLGISEERIDDAAFRLGNYLADKIDPKNPQQRLLKQMWDASPKEDQRALARIMVNMVSKQPTTH
ncbi:DUF3243 domain-containing protein [Sulfoacidibacillus thermotolerans]|uniref:DUF3243 domain-containing protein n=1 Tax=Sulfoacidibacillus thermotolerans TaxID=1765684 RepID=A0A2U3D9Y5_SULT2|nr:DUF3243 domain-containing protein [Sulfoacidibacillus thermotolerans]PWI58072.1 hypothetical protein BM613_05235 [Sulfoacidibacillus thermotolerans]